MTGSVKPRLVRDTDIKATTEAEIERVWKKRCKLVVKIVQKEEMLHNVQELLSSDRLIASAVWLLEGERKEMKEGIERIRMQISNVDREILSLEDGVDWAEGSADDRESECTASQRAERGELKSARDEEDETTDSRPKESEDVIFDVLLCHKLWTNVRSHQTDGRCRRSRGRKRARYTVSTMVSGQGTTGGSVRNIP